MATKKAAAAKKNQPFVVVRTYSAGVHMGYLVSRKGKEVVLRDAHRLHYWVEANSLSQAATEGVGEASRISVAVSEITLTEAIEIIATTEAARVNLTRARWAK
jgi:hypothetical protein